MVIMIGVAIGLVLAGLLFVHFSSSAKYPLLITVVTWAGIILIVVGLVLLVEPAIHWLATQFKAMLDVKG